MGDFDKYMHPLNMMKNYYGESYAFQIAFLIHYQAWLSLPTVFGILLFCYQGYRLYDSQDILFALDSPFNFIYGVICCLWGNYYVESWQKTQKLLQHLWDCSDSSYSQYDERTEHFKFFNIYNPLTRRIEKRKMEMSQYSYYIYQACSSILIIMVIVSIIVYRVLIKETQEQYNDDGTIKQEQTTIMLIENILIKIIYGVLIIIFGFLYKKLAIS